jgi:hypothetical protein
MREIVTGAGVCLQISQKGLLRPLRKEKRPAEDGEAVGGEGGVVLGISRWRELRESDLVVNCQKLRTITTLCLGRLASLFQRGRQIKKLLNSNFPKCWAKAAEYLQRAGLAPEPRHGHAPTRLDLKRPARS